MIQLDIGGGDRQGSAARHRVARVHGQIEHHLLDLTRVDHQPSQPFVQVEPNLHVLAQQASHHFGQAAQNLIQIHHSRLEQLLATESQQLLRQRRGALTGPVDLEHVGARRRRFRHRVEQQEAVAEDDRQQVVEIVGDTPGEPADRLHLLGLA